MLNASLRNKTQPMYRYPRYTKESAVILIKHRIKRLLLGHIDNHIYSFLNNKSLKETQPYNVFLYIYLQLNTLLFKKISQTM